MKIPKQGSEQGPTDKNKESAEKQDAEPAADQVNVTTEL
jgi:hypothetical protein